MAARHKYLIIAEKPELARQIAKAIPDKPQSNGQDFIIRGQYCITWLYGHILTLKDPEDYDQSYADRNNLHILPIFFEDWDVKPAESKDGFKRKHLKRIGEMLKSAECVIHAGDPDEEGQLIVDEVLRWHKYQGPVYRLDTGNTAEEALKKALKTIFDNSKWAPMGNAALARSIADFATGINMTRLFSTLNGMHLPIGRVKSPTLALIVRRDSEIANHQKVYYYEITAQLSVDGRAIRVKYKPNADDVNLVDGKILDRKYAEEIRDMLHAQQTFDGVVSKKDVAVKPPLPFNLVDLQSACSSKFGYDPAMTMEITQSLRTKYQAITYNRTDCRYISEEHYLEAPATTAATMQNLNIHLRSLDTSKKPRCVNNANITAHTAIIPSGKRITLSDMTEQEQNVYKLIALRYLAQFMPDAIKIKTTLECPTKNGGALVASSLLVKTPGWLAIIKEDAADAADKELDMIPEGRYPCDIMSSAITDCETKPKPHYTKATLNEDMTRIAKYVEDKRIKQLLLDKDEGKKGENGSIGTEATRSTIIDELVTLGYAKMDGKHIISTVKGREIIRVLPQELKTPELTALWWAVMKDIMKGTKQVKDLTNMVLDSLTEMINREHPTIDKSLLQDGAIESYGPCPICGKPVIKGSKGFGCSGWREGCPFVIWINAKEGPLRRITITPSMMTKFLRGERVPTRSLSAKDKPDTYVGVLFLEKTDRTKCGYGVGVSFGSDPIGVCPSCGCDVVERKSLFCCNNKNCDFKIWKTGYDGSWLSKTSITARQVKQLLAGKPVDDVTLFSKEKQTTYTGSIRLENTDGTWRLAPVRHVGGHIVGKCPRCSGNVVTNNYGYMCENAGSGCEFHFYAKTKYGMMRNTTITNEMAMALLEGAHYEVSTLARKDGTTFSGRIHMDDTEMSEYGPNFILDDYPPHTRDFSRELGGEL